MPKRKKNRKNKRKNQEPKQEPKDPKLNERMNKTLDLLMKEAMGKQDTGKKLFDSIFQSLLGGEKSKKLTQEEIEGLNEDTMILISEVKENIDKVLENCEKIKGLNLNEIEGLHDLPDDEDDFRYKGIVLTQKQEANMKKKNS